MWSLKDKHSSSKIPRYLNDFTWLTSFPSMQSGLWDSDLISLCQVPNKTYSVFFRLRKRPFAVNQLETLLRSRLRFSCSWSMFEAAVKITVSSAYNGNFPAFRSGNTFSHVWSWCHIFPRLASEATFWLVLSPPGLRGLREKTEGNEPAAPSPFQLGGDYCGKKSVRNFLMSRWCF